MAVTACLLVAGLMVAMVAGVCLGSVHLGVGDVLGAVGDNLTGRASRVDPIDQYIIWDLRVPRVLLAALVGAALALAGTALQGLVRNPLADPYVIGVSSGGTLGAVLVMAYGTTALAGLSVSVAAFAGAVVVLVAVFAFAQISGTFTDSRLVLAGVALSYVTTAITSFVQLQAQPDQISGILFWTLGSVAAARWSNVLLPLIVTVLCGGWLLTRGRGLNALALGDDDATAVGVDIRTFRLGLLVVAALLTAVSVSNAGGVGFVGLIVPQTVRLVVGGDHRRLLPLSAVAGALLLVCVDLVARTVASPAELPLTIFTSLIGGPLFLMMMRRKPAEQG
ncbi:FecCD family ABC transporter permease [Streptomyces sp. NBC_00448]|uniref:FecCD family ABC transporter permease n=1 Tax=Streptomyces sp. NBC_00448 TaxID=2903652 RepID=UPI002E1A97F9